jgi:transaldolase
MAKLGAHYISPFIGRLDDAGGDGLLLVKELAQTMNHYNFSTHILAASIRNIHHFEGAIVAGADAITVPVSILEHVVEHQLTNKGMDQFLADWKTLHIKKFPQP